MTVPERRLASRGPAAGQHVAHLLVQLFGLDEPVRPLGDRDRALGVLAQRQARNAEVRALLLDPAGIGDHGARAANEVHELDVAEGLGEGDVRAVTRPSVTAPSVAWAGAEARARMSPNSSSFFRVLGCTANTSGRSLRRRHELSHERLEVLPAVDVRRPVKRHDGVVAALESHRVASAVRLDLRTHHLERVDHDVADAVDLVRGHPFAREVFVRVRGRRPEDVTDRVGHQSVDFLGHAAVAAAEPGLQVHDRNPEFGADLCAGGGRIHVAHHHDPVRLLARCHLLVRDHHPAGLLCVRAAADLEVKVRARQPEVAKKRVRHVGVVVLPGVDDLRPAPRLAGERVVERRNFHEIRACRRDEVDGDRLGHAVRSVGSDCGGVVSSKFRVRSRPKTRAPSHSRGPRGSPRAAPTAVTRPPSSSSGDAVQSLPA